VNFSLACRASSARSGIELNVLIAQTNRDSATYDGIDWGGERIADEVQENVKEIELDVFKKVTRFSIAGYSLGGLLSRYLIGILHARTFFETVRPVNFTTFASPHIGLPRYPNFFSKLAYKWGPTLLSRTGEQFWSTDSWGVTGKPLLLAMADKNQVFYQALALFPNISIYASAFGDTTVPFVTAFIQEYDPFINHEARGVTFDLDEKYSPLIESYQVPLVPPPPPPKPKFGTAAYWRSRKPKISLPPILQYRFPGNVIVYLLLPVLIPTFFVLLLTRLSLETSRSRKRIKLLEKDESATERLVHVFQQFEHGVEEAVIEIMGPEHPAPANSPEPSEPSITSPPPENDPLEESTSGGDIPFSMQANASDSTTKQPMITPEQKQMIAALNSLPRLKKYMAYFPNVRNAHAPIVCRDVKNFPHHKRGEGVLKHWVDHFTL